MDSSDLEDLISTILGLGAGMLIGLTTKSASASLAASVFASGIIEDIMKCLKFLMIIPRGIFNLIYSNVRCYD